ncbi:MAG: DNA polymerase III subunit delta' [Colwellia sp.]
MNHAVLNHQQQLSQQFSHQKLPHAILISGVTGAGKNELAQWLIQLLLCQQPQGYKNVNSSTAQILTACGQCKTCLLSKSNSYPDHSSLLPKTKSIGVDEVRFANAFLEKTAHIGVYKTVLIADAQIMTTAAANALLKTLEEPSSNSVLILLTDDVELLLPTVVSRCRLLTIRPLVGDALLNHLHTNITETDISDHLVNDHAYVNLSQLPELTDVEINEQYQNFKQLYLAFLTACEAEKQQNEVSLLNQMHDNKHALRWLEKITVSLLRQQTVNDTASEKHLPANFTLEMLNQLYKIIISSNKVLKSYTQANRSFIIEQLLVAMSQVSGNSNNQQESSIGPFNS